MTHTAGFSYSWYNASLYKWVQSQNLDYGDKTYICPLVNIPGTKWDYGMSMDWAGVVLQAASGKSLGGWAKGVSATNEIPTDCKNTSLTHLD